MMCKLSLVLYMHILFQQVPKPCQLILVQAEFMLNLLESCGLDISLKHVHFFLSFHQLGFNLFHLLFKGHYQKRLLLITLRGLRYRS
jgi:hypothetical protein